MKKYLATILALFIFCITVTSSYANDVKVREFIENVSDGALSIIKSPDLSDSDRYNKLNDLFVKSVDTEWMARFVIASHWREFSDSQKKQYLSIYKTFLVNSYVPKFESYNNQKIVINKIIARDGGVYVVRTEITSADDPAYKVDYYIRETKTVDSYTGRDKLTYKIYDIVAEGISLITTERSDFTATLSREGIDGFLAKLKAQGEKS